MPRLFINYRRDDTRDFAGRLDDAFSEHFGRENVFRDVNTIWPGLDWLEAIEKGLDSCDVLLAVIGKQWLPLLKERQDHPDEDQVRQEIQGALQAKKIVIPVLAQGATMPVAHELPESLAKLARRNAVEITDARWDYDVKRLIEAIERLTGAKGGAPPPLQRPVEPAPPPPAPAERQNPLAQLTPMSFLGRWQMEDSAMTSSRVDFYPNGVCQGLVSNPMYGFNLPFLGRWGFVPVNQTLQVQGLINGFQPVNVAILIQTALPNGFQGTTMDGLSCRLTRLA